MNFCFWRGFKWACSQMARGKIVRPVGITGAVVYKTNDQGLILWSFDRGKTWERANIFCNDLFQLKWEVVIWVGPHRG